MSPFPHQAGAASALLGMLQFALGAATSGLVGLFTDGTSRPMTLTMAVCAVLAVSILIAAEGKRRVT
jgi:DHA1 family bicyclomycin/chloramphenicol resistance-like MFS transporter